MNIPVFVDDFQCYLAPFRGSVHIFSLIFFYYFNFLFSNYQRFRCFVNDFRVYKGGHGKRSEIPIDLAQQIPIEKTFDNPNKEPIVSNELNVFTFMLSSVERGKNKYKNVSCLEHIEPRIQPMTIHLKSIVSKKTVGKVITQLIWLCTIGCDDGYINHISYYPFKKGLVSRLFHLSNLLTR